MRCAGPVPSSIHFSLSEEQELIRRSAREFCEREILPHVRDWDREEDIDRALVQKLADVGYIAGWELDTVSYALVMEELGACRLVRARDCVGQRRTRRKDHREIRQRCCEH